MSVNEKILTWLETELFEGRLELGQNLPNDRKIARIVGASHSSTREALKQLEIMGILCLFEGKRKTIIARLVAEPFTSATPALRLQISTSRHPMRDIVQTRILLESWAVSQSRASEQDLDELETILASMQREEIFPQEFHQYEVNFHIKLTELAGNQLISGLMTSLREPIYDYLLSIMGRVPLWSATAIRLRAEHRAILAALRNGDTATASQLIVSTIENQYAEAGIDLDEETEVANELPGTQAVITPVEVEQDDLLPEEWEGTVSPDVIEALENIGAFLPQPQTSQSEPEPIQPVAEPSVPPQQRETRGQAHQSPARRLRGVVSSPVHATVIKPINRSTPAPSTDSAPESKPAKVTDKPATVASAEKKQLASNPQESTATHNEPTSPKRSKRLGQWLGFGQNTEREKSSTNGPQEVVEDPTQAQTILLPQIEVEAVSKPEHSQAPEGYEYADSAPQRPEFIDETPQYQANEKTEQEFNATEAEDKADLGQKRTHTISKNAKKKKGKNR